MLGKCTPLTPLLLITLLTLSGQQALAQEQSQPSYESVLSSQETDQYTVLHVNPAAGNDQEGSGAQHQPFRTITHAIQVAQSNTVIVLAPGRYTADTGESFPLRLKPGITIQGSPDAENSAIILGGGNFDSPTLSQQNVAIVAADRSGMAHVVISNQTPQGHGVWVESGSPIIRETAFVANHHTGLYVAGGNPVIEASYFFRNQVAGLVIYGSSRAVVRGNHFEATGTAITVAEEAIPEIAHNRILRNEEGIVLLGNASPVLTSNEISQNRRNGVVEVATAAPVGLTEPESVPQVAPSTAPAPTNIAPSAPSVEAQAPSPVAASATTSDQGLAGNTLEQSGEIVLTSPPPIAPTAVQAEPIAAEPIAAGPIAAEPIAEEEEAGETLAPIEVPAEEIAVPLEATPPEASNQETLESPLEKPLETIATPLPEADLDAVEAAPVEDDGKPLVANESSPSIAELRNRLTRRATTLAPEPTETPEISPSAAPTSIAIQVIGPRRSSALSETDDDLVEPSSPERSISERPEEAENEEAENDEPSADEAASRLPRVSVTAVSNTPPRPTSDGEALPSLPTSADGRLLVPGPNIPIGSGGGSSAAFTLSSIGASSDAPPPPPSRATALGLRYRVYVQGQDEETQTRLRAVVPDAFRARFEGQPVMQAGAYADEDEAKERLELLVDHDFEAWIDPKP